VRFYNTRAFTSVKAMGMLGNSVWGLSPMQKRLLYRMCVVPVTVSLWIGIGIRPHTSLDYLRQQMDVAAESAWHWSFVDSAYRGHNFLGLKGSKGKPILPTTRKGGPFLSESSSPRMFTQFCRCTMGHAPIGEYRSCFSIDRPVNCDCGLDILETRQHILGQCSKAARSRQHLPIDSVSRLNTFLDKNPGLSRSWTPHTLCGILGVHEKVGF
jgi:hypothetical protein